MLTDSGSRKDAVFTAAYVFPLLQSNREIFVWSPAGTTSAEMFPWRQGRAEPSSKDAPYSPSMGSVVMFVADGVCSKSTSLL